MRQLVFIILFTLGFSYAQSRDYQFSLLSMDDVALIETTLTYSDGGEIKVVKEIRLIMADMVTTQEVINLKNVIPVRGKKGSIVFMDSKNNLVAFITYSSNEDFVSIVYRIDDDKLLQVKSKIAYSDFVENYNALLASISNNNNAEGNTKPSSTTQAQSRSTTKKIEQFPEVSKEITIKDMLYKPLGILTDINRDNLWDVDYNDVKLEAEKRSNWELSSRSKDNFKSGFTLYGNTYEGKKKEKGYNMTYHGEPFHGVSVSAAGYGNPWGKGKIEEYSYSIHRDIKGKKPKYDSSPNIATRPQWTKDEAIRFAERMISELESNGVKMSKTKNMKGDIFTSQGVDSKTGSLIRVRVFKCDDKYSAFFMISLDIKNPEKF